MRNVGETLIPIPSPDKIRGDISSYLQKIIDRAPVNSVLILQKGTYMLHETVILRPGMKIIGQGIGETQIIGKQ
jgi:hypothetical protein